MSNGYLIAAGNDVAAAHEISDGFGLDVIDAASMADPDNAASALAAAANVGLLISSASASDAHYVAVLRALAQHLQRVQLILVDADARAAFPFLPETWPAMSLDDARGRAAELVRRRDATPEGEADRAAPIPASPEPEASAPEPEASAPEASAPEPEPSTPEPEAPPHQAEAPPAEQDAHAPIDAAPQAEAEAGDDTVAKPAIPDDAITQAGPEQEHPPLEAEAPPQPAEGEREEDAAPPLVSAETGEAPPPQAPPGAEPPPQLEQPAPAPPPAEDLGAHNDGPAALGGAHAPPEISLPAPAPMPMPAPSAPSQASATAAAPPPKTRGRADASEATAPADATAFAPKKLRRGTPELVQVAIHQPKDLKAVIQAAKKANPSAEPAPQGVHIGDVALGASIGVALETHGATCDGAMQRRPWRGDPIDFSFSVEADDEAKKAVFIARVFIDDAQIGVIGFTRPISGPKKKAAQTGDGARLKRHKRVFLSYASTDRETVSAIATAYAAAGVPHFWDRASLKSGEEWSPRLRKEIDRADLFHLCWSKSAATSQWVEKETEHALTRRRRSKGKNPDITVQMLDGPPWAPHPRELDAINFDDFVRAAIVGYARGDGSS